MFKGISKEKYERNSSIIGFIILILILGILISLYGAPPADISGSTPVGDFEVKDPSWKEILMAVIILCFFTFWLYMRHEYKLRMATIKTMKPKNEKGKVDK